MKKNKKKNESAAYKNNPFTAHVHVAETDWMFYIMSLVVQD